jgi:translation initiation factor 5
MSKFNFSGATIGSIGFVGNVQININGSDDPFYRYKMPKLMMSVESRHGGQTVLVNLPEVAKALERPVEELHSHFGRALSCRSRIQNNRYILSGTHTSESLSNLLTIYIKKNILCDHCGNPETVLTKNGRRACRACGAESIK